MKNMKKLLQKAMVFTLSAAMLVGTPMTASAAGLVDLYSISDGTDIVDDTNEGPVGTVTNTDTNTGALIKAQSAKIVGIALDRETVSAEVGTPETLKATVMLDSEIKVPKEYGSEELIDITDDVVAEMSKKIKWEVLYLDENGNKKGKDAPNPAEKVAIEGQADNRSEITLIPQHGTEKGGEVTVRATIDASYYFEVNESVPNANKEQDTIDWNKWSNQPDKYIIKDDAREGLIYTANATVSVKEYSTGLSWSDKKIDDTLDMKHTVDLSAKLVRNPETANDVITWVSDTPKYATVNATGVVTAKKDTPDGTKVKITAVSERGAVAERNFTIGKGQKAEEVAIFVDTKETKAVERNLSSEENSRKMTVTAVMYTKVKKAYVKDGAVVTPTEAQKSMETIAPEDIDGTLTNNVRVKSEEWYIDGDGKAQKAPKITDTITWSSNKAAVATVATVDDTNGAVSLKGVGTAAITAKATNGKSAKVNVKVTANLNDLTIVAPAKAYSGQIIPLSLTRDPKENKDAVKWSVTDENDAKITYATINAKGILTIKNQVTAGKIKVKVETTKAVKDVLKDDGTTVKEKVSKTATLTVAQSSIDGITVFEGTDTGKDPIARVGLDNNKIKQLMKAGTSNINVPLTKTYTAVVVGDNLADGTQPASLLTWKTSNAKVASLKQTSGGKVEIKAEGSGTAKITVSGVREVTNPNNGKKTASVISTNFTVKVKQPVTTLTMNKPTVTLVQKDKLAKGKPTGDVQPQKVALKVTFGPKKADKSQTKIAAWTIEKVGSGDKPTTVETGSGKNKKPATAASVSVTIDEPRAGETYKITAKSITGATATSTVTIAAPTTEVAIVENLDDGKITPFKATINNKEKTNEALLTIGNDKAKSKITMVPVINLGTATKKANETNKTDWVLAGARNSEQVTYTVNKKGIVTIDKDGNVYAVKKGVVTITAKTPTGKKATLKVTVQQ